MPGGIDPHTHLDMPFMGANSADDYEHGTRAALSGGTTMVVDFCIPGHGQPLMEALGDWDKRAERATSDYSFHMCITYWSDKVREDMAKVVDRGVTTFKHFMAYKGSLMVNDEELFASFRRCAEIGALPLVHAENGELVAALQKHYLAKGVTGPEGHALSRPPEVEGEATNRAIILADQAGVPLYVVHTSCIAAHEAIAARAFARHARLRRAADPASRARRERVLQQGLGACGAPRHVAAVPRQDATRTICGTACAPARCKWWRPTIARSPPGRRSSAAATSPRSPTAPAASKTACRCCGPTASAPAG